jgi:hypothetical protein
MHNSFPFLIQPDRDTFIVVSIRIPDRSPRGPTSGMTSPGEGDLLSCRLVRLGYKGRQETISYQPGSMIALFPVALQACLPFAKGLFGQAVRDDKSG